MNIDLVIAQVRRLATVFGGNVSGSAKYEKGVQDQVWLTLPAAYVIPLGTDVERVESMTGYYQIAHEKIGVIVVLDNSADRRGQNAVSGLDVIQKSIFSAILNWRPDSSVDNPTFAGDPTGLPSAFKDDYTRGFAFDGDGLLSFDLARLFYQFDFVIDRTIGDDLCWQQNSAPLTSIDMTATTRGSVDVLATVDLPQS